MAMTDSHPTWDQSPPLELDCTTRPHRRGELLCLPSPDRPIRAARNWDVLGPTARWDGLRRKNIPLVLNNPHNTHIHQPHATRHACTIEQKIVWGASSELHQQSVRRDTQLKVWGAGFSPLTYHCQINKIMYSKSGNKYVYYIANYGLLSAFVLG